MRLIISYSILFLMCVLCSCTHKEKKKIAFYDSTDVSSVSDGINSDLLTASTDEIVVPFEENGGVKLIDVKVNGQFTVKMILDSGCSGTLISIAEAKYLYDKGCISDSDILGYAKSQIADGSIVENMVINLKELVIGNRISCTNVTATVSANAEAPLLLGNEVLNRAASYSVDNTNKVIIFKLR